MEQSIEQKVSPGFIFDKIEKGICIAAIVSLVIIATGEAITRPFGGSIPASNKLLLHFLLLLGLFSGMVTAKKGEHLSISLIQYVKNEKARNILGIITGLLAVFVCTIIAWSSISFIKLAITPELVGFIPNIIFILAMPLAYGVMAARFALRLPGKSRFISIPVVVLATAVSFSAIAKLIWGIDPPDFVFDAEWLFSGMLYTLHLPLIILLIAVALMGAPIFTVIAGISLVIIQSAGGEAEAVTNSIFSAFTDSADIIAIPLFTFTGFILSESRAGERLVHTFRNFFSWIPGGMIIATVIICAFFTSFTGASGVTILALGGILYTVLAEKSTYPQPFTIGLLTSAGCIGLLFPPSLPIILAGAASRTNIIHVFLGALIPGIILVIAMATIGIVASRKVKIPVEPFRLGKAASSLKGSALEIILPVFLIVGYFSGALSLVEVSAVSVIYVFIAEVLVHREIKLSELPHVFYKALPIIGGILTIIATAKALSFAIVDTQAPENFARWLGGVIGSKYLFLLLLNLALLAIGCVMDIFSSLLVILPLIVPLGVIYGIDPVHLVVIFIINMEVGFLTPPVGINLFLSSYRFGRPFMDVCRYVIPFLLVQLAVVLLVTYVPILSTFLPRFF